jgi:hypothetical protein
VRSLVFVIGLALAAHAGGVGELFERDATPVDAAAVAIKCHEISTADTREECIDRYSGRFITGQLDPMAVLRQHCTRFQSEWDLSSGSEPPSTCVEQFGGWLES